MIRIKYFFLLLAQVNVVSSVLSIFIGSSLIGYFQLYSAGLLFIWAIDFEFNQFFAHHEKGIFKKFRLIVIYPVMYFDFAIKRRKFQNRQLEQMKNLSISDIAKQIHDVADKLGNNNRK